MLPSAVLGSSDIDGNADIEGAPLPRVVLGALDIDGKADIDGAVLPSAVLGSADIDGNADIDGSTLPPAGLGAPEIDGSPLPSPMLGSEDGASVSTVGASVSANGAKGAEGAAGALGEKGASLGASEGATVGSITDGAGVGMSREPGPDCMNSRNSTLGWTVGIGSSSSSFS